MTFKIKGFGLIEVMLAFIMLIVGLMGTMKLHSYMEKQADYAENAMTALQLAESQLEYYRSRSFDGKDNTLQYDTIGNEHFSALDKFQVTITVHSLTSDVALNLKQIQVEVSWLDRWNTPQSVRLETQLSPYSEFENLFPLDVNP